MRICEQCGNQIKDEILQQRCPKCGAKLQTPCRQEGDAEAGIDEKQQKKTLSSKRLKYAVGTVALLLVIGLLVFLVCIQKVDTKNIEKLYGEWVTDNGVLSLTFQEDEMVRVGAGGGLLGAELFTYAVVDDNTLQFQVQAEGVAGKIADLISMQIDYVLEEDELRLVLFGETYTLHRKN